MNTSLYVFLMLAAFATPMALYAGMLLFLETQASRRDDMSATDGRVESSYQPMAILTSRAGRDDSPALADGHVVNGDAVEPRLAA
jgi:hypothetical protein